MGLFGSKGGAPDITPAVQATEKSLKLQERMYDEGVERLQPWMQTGEAGVDRLRQLMIGEGAPLAQSFTMQDYQEDPGYQFRLGEGEKTMNRALAARGRYDSGAALKGLTEYGQNLASQEYGNAYNRYNMDQQNLFNRLAALSGFGQTSAGQVAGMGQNYANQASNLHTGLANTQIAANQFAASQPSMFDNLLNAGVGAAAMYSGFGF